MALLDYWKRTFRRNDGMEVDVASWTDVAVATLPPSKSLDLVQIFHSLLYTLVLVVPSKWWFLCLYNLLTLCWPVTSKLVSSCQNVVDRLRINSRSQRLCFAPAPQKLAFFFFFFFFDKLQMLHAWNLNGRISKLSTYILYLKFYIKILFFKQCGVKDLFSKY